jgi:hypothetical protein
MLKDKLQSKVKPNIFWLSIIILLALCACLYILLEKERTLRTNIEQQLSRTITENNVLGLKLVKANKEIAARDKQIKLTLDKLEAAIKEKDVVIKEKEVLEEKIKEVTAQSSNVELPKIVVKTPP